MFFGFLKLAVHVQYYRGQYIDRYSWWCPIDCHITHTRTTYCHITHTQTTYWVMRKACQFIKRLHVHRKYNSRISQFIVIVSIYFWKFWSILMHWQYIAAVCFIYWTLFLIYWTSTSKRSVYCEGLIILLRILNCVQRPLSTC